MIRFLLGLLNPVGSAAAWAAPRALDLLGKIGPKLLPFVPLLLALGLSLCSLHRADRDLRKTRVELAKEQTWGNSVLDAARTAAANPKLARADAPAQIAALGTSLGKVRDGLKVCGDSARAAAKNDADRQAALAQQLAAVAAQGRARQSVIDRLRASAAQPAPAGAREPSDTLKGLWK